MSDAKELKIREKQALGLTRRADQAGSGVQPPNVDIFETEKAITTAGWRTCPV